MIGIRRMAALALMAVCVSGCALSGGQEEEIPPPMRDNEISLESLLQHGRSASEAVAVVITTHETEESAMVRALDTIAALDAVMEPPRLIRIEPLIH